MMSSVIYDQYLHELLIKVLMQGGQQPKLWNKIEEDPTLKAQLDEVYCFTSKNNSHYHLSYCSTATDKYFFMFSRKDALLILNRNGLNTSLSLIDINETQPVWNFSMNVQSNLQDFVQNQLQGHKINALISFELSNRCKFDGKLLFMHFENSGNKGRLEFINEQAFLKWKRILRDSFRLWEFQTQSLSVLEKNEVDKLQSQVQQMLEQQSQQLITINEAGIPQASSKMTRITSFLLQTLSETTHEGVISQSQESLLQAKQITQLKAEIVRLTNQANIQQNRLRKELTDAAVNKQQAYESAKQLRFDFEQMQKNKDTLIGKLLRENQVMKSQIEAERSRNEAERSRNEAEQESKRQELREQLRRLNQKVEDLIAQRDQQISKNLELIQQQESFRTQAENVAKNLEKQKAALIKELQILQTELKQTQLKASIQLRQAKQSEEQKMKSLNAILNEQKKATAQALESAEQLRFKTERLEQERYLHIFQGQVLHDHQSEKEFLAAEIERLSQRTVQMTNLLYRYDPLNKINFHNYVDHRTDICLVIRLANGRLIAGYSMSALAEDSPISDDALILSLTQNRSFRLSKGRRALTYDPFFLIFGNSELRIRQGELNFFTNFGINNSFFKNDGYDYSVLTGTQAGREVTMSNYEIFQVIFK